MKEYTSIEKLISNLKKQIAEDQKLIGALQAIPVTPEQVLLLKYIETRSTPKTARVMRESGVQNPAGKSFQPADVSGFINSGHESLDPILLDYARRIFLSNKKTANRKFN